MSAGPPPLAPPPPPPLSDPHAAGPSARDRQVPPMALGRPPPENPSKGWVRRGILGATDDGRYGSNVGACALAGTMRPPARRAVVQGRGLARWSARATAARSLPCLPAWRTAASTVCIAS